MILLDFCGAGEDNGRRGTDSAGGPSCRPTNSVKALKELLASEIEY